MESNGLIKMTLWGTNWLSSSQVVASSCLISEKYTTNLETDTFWSQVTIYARQFLLISHESLTLCLYLVDP